MAVDHRRGNCSCGTGLDGLAILVYIDIDFRGLGHGIDSINNNNEIGVLLRVLMFVDMASAFEIVLATPLYLELTRLTMWLSRY